MRRLVAVLICISLVLGLVPIPLQIPVARADAGPSVTLNMPPETMIGESLTFTATLDNTSADTGYGPFIDLVFPFNGVDGAHGTATADGLSFMGATYLGASVTATVLIFPDDDVAGPGTTGHVLHPYAVDAAGNPLWVYGTAGDKLVVLQLPFGSFTGAQPPASIVVSASLSNMADLNAALTVRARAGFQFGNTAVNDPATDPSIVSNLDTNSTNWTVAGSTIPTVLRLSKTYVGPEDETATGPNYPRKYTVTADIASGQTITTLDLTDALPGNLQFVSVDNVTPAGSVVATPSTTTPGGTLTRRIATVTGTTATSDASMTFSFYVPLLNTISANVIVPATGAPVMSEDDASARGAWTPIDSRDAPATVTSDVTTVDHTLHDRSIAIQKSVAIVGDVAPAGFTPGDTLEYTLDFQVSDYFAFQNVRISSDVISDGQLLDGTFVPTYSVTENGAATSGGFGSTFWTSAYSSVNGTTSLTFDISGQLGAATTPRSGQLLGGLVWPASVGLNGDGATRGIMTFRTVVQDKYVNPLDPRKSLDEGDSIGNQVTISGDLLDKGTVNPGSSPLAPYAGPVVVQDGSSASLTIAEGALNKSVYAINGNTTLPSPLRMAPGDLVTYRIRYSLIIGDFENLRLTDYLPLPVFSVTDPADIGEVTHSWTRDTTSVTVPNVGKWMYGPGDTYHVRPSANVPTFPGASPLIVDSAANSLEFYYGTYEDTANQASVIDLLFSVAVSSDPFADGLFLTNQVRQADQNTVGTPAISDAIVQIQLTEPVLKMSKGVVATDRATAIFAPTTVGPVAFNAPGTAGVRWTGTIASAVLAANPVNSNLTGVDAGDKVTYAIVVENTGSGINGAFDVKIKDVLPTGYTVGDVTNIQVRDGAGTPIGTAGPLTDLFGAGIELVDPSLTAGSLAAGKDAAGNPVVTGLNIAVITYDLTVRADAEAGAAFTNSASVISYAGAPGGPSHPLPPADDATVTILMPASSKSLVSTSIEDVSNDRTHAVIGEKATYSLVITVPEGQMSSVTVVDTLGAGLAFVGIVGVARSSTALATSIGATDFSDAPAAFLQSVGASGLSVTFGLGTLTNTNRDNTVAETVTITYEAVVLNASGNQSGTTLRNSAVVQWNTTSTLTPAAATAVTVLEPYLTTTKTRAFVPSTAPADAGATVRFTIVVANANTAADTMAYDVVLTDSIPAGVTYVPTTLVVPAGGVATWPTATSFRIEWPSLAKNSTLTVTFDATIDGTVFPGQSITNTANTSWTSLPLTPGQVSSYNANSFERTGVTTDPGLNLNDYRTSSAVNVVVANVASAKSIVTTSETSSTGSNVTIGEIARYRLVLQLPESTVANLQLRDALPDGLMFLDDGTARFAFVADADLTSAAYGTIPAVTFVELAGTFTLAQVNDPATLLSSSITGVFADENVSSSETAENDTYSSGTDFSFKFGTVTNTDRDDNAEFVVVEFNALVDNTATGSPSAYRNLAGNTRANSFRARRQDGAALANLGSSASSPNVTVQEPSITLSKSVTPTSGDAGDTVQYTVIYTNASAVNVSTAFDVQLTDVLPSNMTLTVSSVSVTGAAFADSSSGNTVSILIASIVPGGSVTVTYDAVLKTSVTPGQILTNNAGITYGTLPGTGTTSNPTGSVTPGASGTSTGERTYTGSRNAPVTVFLPVPVKGLTSTSEGATVNADVTVGEIVRYHLSAQLPEGTTSALSLVEVLPIGMTLIDNAQAKISFVANTAMTLEADISGANGSANPPTFVLPAGRIAVSGQQVTFTLGNVLNNDADADGEYILLEFNALVQNIPANAAPKDLVNTFAVHWTGAPSFPSATQTTHLVEPSITTLTKATTTGPVDAGDTVVYTLTFSNTGSTAAFDVILTDQLNANLSLVSVGVTAPTGSTVDVTHSVLGAAGLVDVRLDQLLNVSAITSGVTNVTITVTARVIATAAAGQSIPNNAQLTYSSLPGEHGTMSNPTGSSTPGIPGAADGERVYPVVTSNTVTSTLATPTIVKQAPARANWTIGEDVSYDILVTLPEGTTRSLAIADILPAGMSFVSASVVTTAAASNGNLTLDFAGTVSPSPTGPSAGSTGTLAFTFGDTLTTDDNDTGNNAFVLRVVARVDNVLGNQSGTQLANTASLTYANPQSGQTSVGGGSRTVSVVEPQLTMSKAIIGADAGLQAGDNVRWQIVITNTGTSTANQILWSDTLPDGVWHVTAVSVGVSGTGSVFLNGTATPLDTSHAHVETVLHTDDKIRLESFSMEVGAVVTVTFDSILMDTITPGEILDNMLVQAAYASLPTGGHTTGTRDASDGGSNDPIGSQAAPLNNYEVSTHKQLTTSSDIALAKTASKAHATIGETLDYTLRVALIEGTTPNLVVTDMLPVGLSYVSHSVVKGNTGITFTNTEPIGRTGSGQTASFDLGTVVNPSNLATSDDYVDIVLAAVVDNVAGNQASVFLTNMAYLTYGSPQAPIRVDYDADSVTPGAQGLDLTLTEPGMTLNKTLGTMPSPVDAGAVVSYHAVLTSGTGPVVSSAFDLIFTDQLPSVLTLQSPFTVVTSPLGIPTASSVVGNLLTVQVPELKPGETVTVDYTALLNDTLPPSHVVTNNAGVTWTSLPGTVGGERTGADGTGGLLNDYAVGSTASFTSSSTMSIAKALFTTSATHTPGSDVTIGEELTFDLAATLPEGMMPSVTVADSLPSGLVYVPGSATLVLSGFGGTIVAGDPQVTGNVSFGFTNVVVHGDNDVMNNVFVIRFRARVANTTAMHSGVSLLNTASLTVTGVEPVTSNEVTATVVEPNLTITKTTVSLFQPVGGTVEYTLVVAHDAASTATAEDVLVTDTLPAGLSYVPGSFVCATPGVTLTVIDPQHLSIAIGEFPLTAGAISITYKVLLSSTAVLGTPLSNSAIVTWASIAGASGAEDGGRTGSGTDPNSYHALDDAPVTPLGPMITKTGEPESPGRGETVTYTVTYTNTALIPATNLVLTEHYSPQFVFVSASIAPDSGFNNRWTFPTVAPGASVTVVITGNVSVHATQKVMPNTVTFTTDEGWNGGAGIDLELDLPVGGLVYPVNKGGIAAGLAADMFGILALLAGALYLAFAAKRRIQTRR